MHDTRLSDFKVGDVRRSYRRTVTEADLVNFTCFAGLRLPIFIDEEYALTEGPFGGRIAPGFLTASISAGMLESVLGNGTLAGLALDGFRFKTPVRPGDTLCAEVRVTEARATRDPTRGVVSLAVRVFNQREELALAYTTTVLMRV